MRAPFDGQLPCPQSFGVLSKPLMPALAARSSLAQVGVWGATGSVDSAAQLLSVGVAALATRPAAKCSRGRRVSETFTVAAEQGGTEIRLLPEINNMRPVPVSGTGFASQRLGIARFQWRRLWGAIHV